MAYLGRILCVFLFSLAQIDVARASTHGNSVATVVEVQISGIVDLVLLDTGLDGGVRQGMVCFIYRKSRPVAEVLIVDSRASSSAAVIVKLSTDRTIQFGDSVTFKALKTNSSTKKRVERPSGFATIADSGRNT